MPTHGHIPSAGLESWLTRGDADDQEHSGSSTARLGASATVLRGRVRLALPRGFLVRWHRAEIPARAQHEDTPWQPIADVERQLIAGTDRERVASATVLLSLGPEAVRAMPSVLAALGDRQQQVRWRAVEILRLVGPPPEALPRLIEALQSDACRSVRWRAAEALGARSLPAEACARALIEAAQDADEWVRWHADRVVAQVIDRSTVHDLLPEYASSPIPAIRAYAIGLLAHMDTIDNRLIDALVENLWHPVDAVRTQTLEFLLRHCPRAHPQVTRGVRLCLEHQHPEIRVRAVKGLARIGGRRAQPVIHGVLADQAPSVRVAAVEALADKVHERGSRAWLRSALGDAHHRVRLTAARALVRAGVHDSDVVTVLVNAVNRSIPSLEAWRALLTMPPSLENPALQALENLPPTTTARLVGEDVAAEVLPTIGLRLWPEAARVRFPNKEGGDLPPLALGYPWVNIGVYHNWENHLEPHHVRLRGITKQICLAAAPFADAHLIVAAEFARYVPADFDGTRAPVHLEGRPVGTIVEGMIGTDVRGLRRPRLDFVYGIDLRFCQYATFAALGGQVSSSTSELQERARGQWTDFVASMSEVLATFGLEAFRHTQWFDPAGWQSSRYGLRRERLYPEIREGVMQFVAALRSARGRELAIEILTTANRLADTLERAVWRTRIGTYPPGVQRHLASHSFAGRLGRYATAGKEAG